MGPMKRHHLLPASVLQPILAVDPTAFPTGMAKKAPFQHIANAANLGCRFCSIVRDGILSFADGEEVETVALAQNMESRSGNDMKKLGHLYPLSVKFQTLNRSTELIFYTNDGFVTKLMPHFTTAAHVSADPSSPECFLKAREWLNCCLQNHGSLQCPSVERATLPTRVICVGDEVNQPYLYESKPGEEGVWAALSYCWGKTKVVTTTMASLPRHKSGIVLEDLPKTCRDAVLAARALSIPYLWIDALCIVQDSSSDWQREAARMCYVYENANVTLAAPQSASSEIGLFLANPNRGTTRVKIDIDGRIGTVYVRKDLSLPMFPMHRHRGDPFNTVTNNTGILETRAWTLQELLLSPRTLWFGSAELGWSCRSSTACECEPEQTSEHMQNDEEFGAHQTLRVSSLPLPKHAKAIDWTKTWHELVQKFTIRDLTVSTDRLPAIAGLACALKTHIQSEYLAGLWRSALDTQLLWVSLWLALNHSNGPPPPFEDDYAPSWTWTSVPGQIRFLERLGHRISTPIWQIADVQFRRLDDNEFGRGKGSIAIESYLLKLHWDNDQLVWASLPDGDGCVEESTFAGKDDVLWDPRSQTQNRSDLMHEPLWFLPGHLSRNQKQCHGLVLEGPSDQSAFVRLGYAEAKFDSSGARCWDVWKRRSTWKAVELM
ncbi:hypothetical protein ST47_g2063 [Ascochyta rabiei]|uniref:Uncharacterized protein n=2 Tax=Didymella rabiei TaxID=5454 RepID=A0A163K615_DIDRA|nr:hypothetical protein ST47_g2063 [Ascochyta rabiei]